MDKFKAWLMQPTTVTGISAFVTVAAMTITHLLTKDVETSVAIGGLAFGFMHIVMPDNAGAATSVQKLVQDAATAIIEKKLATSMPTLVSDTVAVLQTVQTPAAVVPVVVAAPVVAAEPAVVS